MPLTVVPPVNVGVVEAVETLARGLRGAARPACLAKATEATPDEGLALIADYLKIKDPALRQAVLDVVASLAAVGS